MSKIISCPNCGQKNRIHGDSDSSQAICAKCWTKLDVPKKTVKVPPPPNEPYTPPPPENENKEGNGFSFGWVWLLVIGGFIWWVIAQDSNNSTTTRTTANNYSSSHPAPSYPEVTMPYNGEIQMYTNGEQIAPLKIQTSRGANYLVKLVSAYSQKTAMTIFIRGGNTVSTEVPLGTYEIKYASGEKWYGYKHLFGPDTSYSKAEKTFTFKDTGYQISGYTITLYRVSNGNLRTSRISPSQF
ncbi:MAG: hypothetical protein J7J98_07700 [candidate division Zixibacteria bacterium]|nr:hypothetical protein [candidate division Zixibacteria bacterium]